MDPQGKGLRIKRRSCYDIDDIQSTKLSRRVGEKSYIRIEQSGAIIDNRPRKGQFTMEIQGGYFRARKPDSDRG